MDVGCSRRCVRRDTVIKGKILDCENPAPPLGAAGGVREGRAIFWVYEVPFCCCSLLKDCDRRFCDGRHFSK